MLRPSGSQLDHAVSLTNCFISTLSVLHCGAKAGVLQTPFPFTSCSVGLCPSGPPVLSARLAERQRWGTSHSRAPVWVSGTSTLPSSGGSVHTQFQPAGLPLYTCKVTLVAPSWDANVSQLPPLFRGLNLQGPSSELPRFQHLPATRMSPCMSSAMGPFLRPLGSS